MPQLPPLLSSRCIWLSDHDTKLSTWALTASRRAEIEPVAVRASSWSALMELRVASSPAIRLHQKP
jgi:hypothetical protein